MSIYWQTDRAVLYQGNALDVLRSMPANSVHCCVTSPPYWGLRAYGTEPQVWQTDPYADPECPHEWGEEQHVMTGRRDTGRDISGSGGNYAGNPEGNGQRLVSSNFCQLCGAWRGELGLEPTLDLFLTHIVAIFQEVRRVLHPSGTAWVNMGDSWACAPNGRSAADGKAMGIDDRTFRDKPFVSHGSLKEKDLVGQAWALAFALRDAGWWLRDCIIWHKPGPMPSSVRDRFTMAHEYIFLLAKQNRYFFDQFAVRERAFGQSGGPSNSRIAAYANGDEHCRMHAGLKGGVSYEWRNRRSVWTVNTEPSGADHYAAYPKALIKPMVLAGTSEYGCCATCGAPYERIVERSGGTTGKGWHSHGDDMGAGMSWVGRKDDDGYRVEHKGWRRTCKCDTSESVPCAVLDPFTGTGTTGLVALEYGRRFVGIELLPKYCGIAKRRLQQARTPIPGLVEETEELPSESPPAVLAL